MSLVNNVRNKTNYKPQFWWEDGYEAPQQQTLTNNSNTALNDAIKSQKYDSDGELYELTKYTTDLNHMDTLFFHNSNHIVSLRHQRSRSASIAIYSYNSDCGLIPEKIYNIGDNSGYMGLSCDDTILAVGVLKEDYIMIFDVQTGELLINVLGGYKLGFYGQLQFLPGNFNNNLLEVRAIAMDKLGKVKDSVIRSWDLGFKGPINRNDDLDDNKKDNSDDDDDDDDDDEEVKKIWEVKKRGAIKCAQHNNTLICTTELQQKLEWLDHTSGTILRQLSFDSWISKPIISKNGLYVATSHLGSCKIHSIETGELIYTLKSADNDSNYPLVPIQFICNDEVIVCRINQDRSLLLSFFQSISNYNTVTIRSVGGTITDNTIKISSDEKYLVCWPYGVIELYSMEKMIESLYNKMRVAVKIELVKIRLLLDKNRASLKNQEKNINEITTNLNELKLNSHSSSSSTLSTTTLSTTTVSSSNKKVKISEKEILSDKSSSKSKKEDKKSSLKSNQKLETKSNNTSIVDESELLLNTELYHNLMIKLNMNELFHHILTFV